MFKTTLLGVATIALIGISSQLVSAQSDEKKFEAGGQVTFIRVPTFTTSISGALIFDESRATNWGFGGRVGYNFNRHAGVEAEVNFFPQDRDLEAGNKLQGLFGVKAGQRFEKVGIFAKARPGFVRFSRGDYEFRGPCVLIFPSPLACFTPKATTNWAADVGGIAEFYPSPNTIVRFDVGDTVIRLKDRGVAATHTGPRDVVVFRPKETRHNLQVNFGFGFRF
jgi:Outer membrane protein beta-barrel domain